MQNESSLQSGPDATHLDRGKWSDVLIGVAICVAWLLAARLALSAMPPINIPMIRSEFAPSTLAVYAGILAVGAVLARLASFPAPVGGRIPASRRFVWPALLGAAIGVAAAVIDRFTHGADFLARQTGQPTFNVDFPQSLPVYLAGPVLPEAVFHVLPLAFLMLVSRWFVSDAGGRKRAFFVLAGLVALIEPVLQGGGVIAMAKGDTPSLLLTQFLPYFATSYPLNLAACLAFGRSGFLSAMAVRLGFYVVWHILYGNFLYPGL